MNDINNMEEANCRVAECKGAKSELLQIRTYLISVNLHILCGFHNNFNFTIVCHVIHENNGTACRVPLRCSRWNTHRSYWCMHPIIRIKSLLTLALTMRIPIGKPKAALGHSVSILSTRFRVHTKIPKKVATHQSDRQNADLIRFPINSL